MGFSHCPCMARLTTSWLTATGDPTHPRGRPLEKVALGLGSSVAIALECPLSKPTDSDPYGRHIAYYLATRR